MNERTMKLRLGAAVVLSIVIIIIFLTALGSREKFSISTTYPFGATHFFPPISFILACIIPFRRRRAKRFARSVQL